MVEIDGKSCYSVKKMISTSEQRAEHLFTGQNTQQFGVLKTHLLEILAIAPNGD